MTTGEKKIWIGRYRTAKAAEKEIELEIEALESEWMFPSRKMDGMPTVQTGGRGKDLSEMAAECEPLWIMLKEQIRKRLQIYKEIVTTVEHSPLTETERAVLRYRYILCMRWEDIEEEMHMEKSWLHRIREAAVEKLAI